MKPPFPVRRSAPPTAPGRPQIRHALVAIAVLIAVIWGQEIINLLAFGGRLDVYGIRPRQPETFWHVLTAPFLPYGFAHLTANTVPLAVLAFMSAVRGVGRFVVATLLIAVVGSGLVWPASVAPHTVILTVVDMGNAAQVAAAEALYAELQAAGIDTLLDDRPLRAGVKFADADLTGIPYRVTLGWAVAAGRAEIKTRKSGEVQDVTLGEVTAALRCVLRP